MDFCSIISSIVRSGASSAMKIQRFNWQIWTGFVLSIFAFLSYPLVFVNWAATRDFPWANLLLFAMAAVKYPQSASRQTSLLSPAEAGLLLICSARTQL